MKKRQLGLFIFLTLLLIFNISAFSLGRFPQGSTISLHQVCSNCTFVNLTSVRFPNGTLTQFDIQMTKIGFDYNFSFSNTNFSGEYSYNTCGDPDGVETCENIKFTINRLGEELTTGKGIIYVLLTLIVFILFAFVLYVNISLRYQHYKNNQGNILALNNQKYFKIALVPITHALFNWFLNLILYISNNLLGRVTIYYNMLEFILRVSIALAWPIFVVVLVWFIIEWIKDFNFQKQIDKFGRAIK